jgi:hypothetical protein
MRDPQMMRAIGEGRHLAGAAKLGCHLVHFTERPAAAGLVELDQRAGPAPSTQNCSREIRSPYFGDCIFSAPAARLSSEGGPLGCQASGVKRKNICSLGTFRLLTHLGHRCHTQAKLVADESDSQSLRKSCFAETVGELGEVLLPAK